MIWKMSKKASCIYRDKLKKACLCEDKAQRETPSCHDTVTDRQQVSDNPFPSKYQDYHRDLKHPFFKNVAITK